MRMRQIKKSLSFIFCMMLVVAMALFTSGCNGKKTEAPTVQEDSVKTTEAVKGQEEEKAQDTDTDSAELTILGEGETKFFFTVVDKDGAETVFEIHTNEEIVGDALLKLEMISGEEGAYGLYVKSVKGIVADYDADGTYWAFYINGGYAPSGADQTEIKADETYSFAPAV